MATNDILASWFNAIGVRLDYRTMVYYDGTGGDTFEINFEGGYINRADVKSHMVKNDDQTKVELTLTFITESRVKTSEVVPVGWTVLIYRDTPKSVPLAEFIDGAIITATNLDRNAKQAIFGVAEMVDRFDNVNANSEEALKQVYVAVTTSNQALEKAETAVSVSSGANTAAEAAEASALAAVTTANSAAVVADDAYTVASGIEAKADAAVVTAGAANSTANGIDAKATTALSNSASAVTTANAAASSAAAAVTTANAAKATAEGIDAKATEALSTANAAQGTVNAAVAGKVNKAGDTLTGTLLLAGDATVPLAPVTKRQFDVLNSVAFTSTQVETTPWINLTLGSGWTGAIYKYRKVLGMVQIQMTLSKTNAASGDIVTTLPVGYRPVENTHTPVYGAMPIPAGGGILYPPRIIVFPDGRVEINQIASGSSGFNIAFMYPIQ